MDNTAGIDAPIKSVKGVGAKTELLFQKIGVYTIGDILLRFPREYAAFPQPVEISTISQAEPGRRQAVIFRAENAVIVKYTRSMPVTIANGSHQEIGRAHV